MSTWHTSYNHTLRASYLGYVSQAIVNIFVPLLFLTFQSEYSIPLGQITSLVTVNFVVQLLVDLISARFVDKTGYRIPVVAANLFITAGLAGLAVLPELLPSPYVGILLSVFLYAIGGGLMEVLISPIVEACPTERKEAAMSLLHSFYCWGCVLVIAVSTAFFALFGTGNWRVLAVLWALVPAGNAVYFSGVPINQLVEDGKGMSFRELFRMPLFWIFALFMVCAGAAEQSMSQWASAFAESGLHISKAAGDLAGPCFFAVLMGTARALYAKLSDRIHLPAAMLFCGALGVVCYLTAALSPNPVLSLIGCGVCGFSVGILWPGTFSLAAKACPRGGTAMFALFALAGDLGCSGGPTLVGTVSGFFGDRLETGLLAAAIFPALLLVALLLYRMQAARCTAKAKAAVR